MIPLSIVIPILNEEKNINILVKKLNIVLKKNNFKKKEIIFVDDNSQDNTLKIIKKLQMKDKNLKLFIRKAKYPDLSKSCSLGFRKAKYKNILVMDGDLQHPPEYIKFLAKKFLKNEADVVVGSRNLLVKKSPGLGLLRYLSSISIIYLINLFLENKTTDPLSGFFIFKKKIYTDNFNNLYLKGYKILADLIYSSKNPLKIVDQNIFFDSRKSGKSKMNITVLIQLIIFIIRSFLFRWKKKLVN
jgi:dolichol-phosphate mannosyltransferase